MLKRLNFFFIKNKNLTKKKKMLCSKRNNEEIRKKNETLENTIKKLKVSLQSSNLMNENSNKLLKEKIVFAK